MPGFQHHKYIFQSGQSPRRASIFMSVQDPRLLPHCGSALSPFIQQMGMKGCGMWRDRQEFLWSESGNGIWHFHPHSFVRTQSTRNCRKVWKYNLVVAQEMEDRGLDEHTEVSPTDTGAYSFRISPGQKKLEVYFFCFSGTCVVISVGQALSVGDREIKEVSSLRKCSGVIKRLLACHQNMYSQKVPSRSSLEMWTKIILSHQTWIFWGKEWDCDYGSILMGGKSWLGWKSISITWLSRCVLIGPRDLSGNHVSSGTELNIHEVFNWNCFTVAGTDIVQWLMKNLSIEDPGTWPSTLTWPTY